MGYREYRTNRLRRRKGGVSTYIKNNLTVLGSKSISNDICEVLMVQVGVATLFQGTLFRGDIVPRDKIPIRQDSEETLFQVGHHSKVP